MQSILFMNGWCYILECTAPSRPCETSLSNMVIRSLSLPVQVVTLISWYPYGWGKRRGGTLDLVTELILKWYKGLGNLTFDNWSPSAKLISLLTALVNCTWYTNNMHSSSWPCRIFPVLSTIQREKDNQRYLSYSLDNPLALHCLKSRDNLIVTKLPNSRGPYPPNTIDNFSRKQKRRFPHQDPNSSSFIMKQWMVSILWMLQLQQTGSNLKGGSGGVHIYLWPQ